MQDASEIGVPAAIARPNARGFAFLARLVLAAAAAAGLTHAAAAGQPPFPIGVYAGNPDGSDPSAEATFEARFNSFVATMGTAPATMNAFVDFTQPVADWAGNAGWTAWSWTQSAVVGHAVTPVIGIPMSDNQHWYGNPKGSTNGDFFRQIVAGAYDSAYQGIVDAWVNAGFATMYLRLGYEMDGTFMPWFMGADTATQADWVAAFSHLSTLMRARAAADGATAYAVWNPNDQGWTARRVSPVYPGDQYVDVISSDAYSPLYPDSLYDWAAGNGTYNSTIQQWWSHGANMRHYWTYPSSDPSHPRGSGIGWGFENTIAFALAHGKAVAVSESGAGGDGTSTGPVDDPVFPHWLASELSRAKASGLTIAYVNIWDVSLSDGDWAFSMAGDGKPLEAAAWAQALGAN